MARTGEIVTYRDLDARSSQVARLLFDVGFQVGDRVALFMDNNVHYLEIVWACRRSGLVVTPVNRHLKSSEDAQILSDWEAKALIASANVKEAAVELLSDNDIRHAFMVRDAEAEDFNLSIHQVAIRAAAPCPVSIKEQMLEWWGPISYGYYAGTEVNGLADIGCEEWLSRKGSVGKPVLGEIHICNEEGEEVAEGEDGLVYFELPELPFEYHRDPEGTQAAIHPNNATSSALGEVGYVDSDGYLYLTGRGTFIVIPDGVNIYPQEIENLLVTHQRVFDAAVIGVGDSDLGQTVLGVVVPAVPQEDPTDLAAGLSRFRRENLAGHKCRKAFEFVEELPRDPTGKLYMRVLRERYSGSSASSARVGNE